MIKKRESGEGKPLKSAGTQHGQWSIMPLSNYLLGTFTFFTFSFSCGRMIVFTADVKSTTQNDWVQVRPTSAYSPDNAQKK